MRDKSRSKIYGIAEAFAVFFAYLIIPSVILIFLGAFVADTLVQELLLYIIYLIPLCLIYRKTFVEDAKTFKKEYFKVMIKYYLIGFTIMVISNLIINFVIFDGNIAKNETVVREVLGSNAVIGLLIAGIFGPLLEELTFRRGFKNISNKKWVFVVVSSLLFAFIHVLTGLVTESSTGIVEIDWIQLVYLIPYGSLAFAFGCSYAETNNFYSNLFIHMFHNTIILTMILLLY